MDHLLMAPRTSDLTIIVLSFDCAATIGRTIDEALRWSDDVRVIDSFSNDATAEVAAARGATVVQRAFTSYSDQRNWAIENLPDLRSWQLHLDADERLTEGLGAAVLRAIQSGPPEVSAYLMPRLVHFLGGPIRHGGMFPIFHLRLFRTGAAKCENRAYDQHFYATRGEVGRLDEPFIDDIEMSLSEWSRRHVRWAEAEVRELRAPTARTGVEADPRGNPIERRRALKGGYYRLPPLARPWLFFVYRYILRGGFLDGRRGLVFHTLQGLWFRLLVDALLVFGTEDAEAPG